MKILLLVLMPATLLIYNSCQGIMPGSKGFASKACLADGPGGEQTKLMYQSKLSGLKGQHINRQPASVFSQNKVILSRIPPSLDSTSVQTKASDDQTIIERGSDLAVKLVNSCVQQLLQNSAKENYLSVRVAQDQIFPELIEQTYSYTLPQNTTVSELEAAAQADPCVVGVSYNHRYQISRSEPAVDPLELNDPWAVYQGHLSALNASHAFAHFYHSDYGMKRNASKNIIIAVVDSGVDWMHPDLENVMWRHKDGVGFDSTRPASSSLRFNPFDESEVGHGTHVAGLAAAHSHNGIGVTGGMPFRAQIMAVKVFEKNDDDEMMTSTTHVANGIEFAYLNGADVINLSLVNFNPNQLDDSIYMDTLSKAIARGAFIVSAIGNGTGTFAPREVDNENFAVIPARYAVDLDGMLAVGSLDSETGQRSYFSHYSTKYVQIAAPGAERDNKGLYSTIKTSAPGQAGYGRMAGTSMATPLVAAAGALTMGILYETYGIKPPPALVEQIILQSAISAPDLEPYYKNGNKLDFLSLIKTIHKEFPETKGQEKLSHLSLACH